MENAINNLIHDILIAVDEACGTTDTEAKIRLEYEKFKLQWMIDHGFTLTDLMECMDIMLQEDLDGSDARTALTSLFSDWEFSVGFVGGQIWPCFEEFILNDYGIQPDAADVEDEVL